LETDEGTALDVAGMDLLVIADTVRRSTPAPFSGALVVIHPAAGS
jgi:hypothetical protein